MTRSIVERQFGPSAAHYAACEVHASGASLGRLVELCQPRADWRVLDVATGAGHTAAAFAPHVASVVASDMTEEMLSETKAMAARKGLANLETAHAIADALPFANDSFDVVSCRLAAHHFPDIAAFVREAARVLRDNGRIAIVDNITPDETTLAELSPAELSQCAAAYNAFELLRDPSHGRALSSQEWRETLSLCGFRLLAFEQMPKEMEFGAWAERMRCSPETTAELKTQLLDGSPLSRFLKPRTDENGTLHFTLQEALFVAQKPAA